MSGAFSFRGVMERDRAGTRVMVFVDGQNLFKRTRALYGTGRLHPLLLARRLAGTRDLVGVRYYSGVHHPQVEPAIRGATDRRHELMRSVGVDVFERTLRYRWEWGFDRTGLPDPARSRGQTRTWTLAPFRRAREKGIDLAVGLDVMDLGLRDAMDVAVIVSSDTDLCEAARATRATTREAGRPVRTEAAVFDEGRRPILMRHYDYTHRLTRADHDACVDTFDYAGPLDPSLREQFRERCRLVLPTGAGAPA